jgi:hypothetical protein
VTSTHGAGSWRASRFTSVILAEAIIAAFRERKSVLPATDTLDRIGRAARVVAHRRMGHAIEGSPAAPSAHPDRVAGDARATRPGRGAAAASGPAASRA